MKKSLLAILLLMGTMVLKAQSIDMYLITSAGGYFETENTSLTWALGEVVTETFSTDNLYLTQGFIQSFDNETAVKQQPYQPFNLQLYPNPTSNRFIVEFTSINSFFKLGTVNLEIFDVNGRKLRSENLSSVSSSIDVSNFQSGMYLVVLSCSQNTYKQTVVLHKSN